MNEFDLIKKFLEGHGSKIIGSSFYAESVSLNAGINRMGVANGEIVGGSWYFGNVSMYARLTGVVDLANENRVSYSFGSELANFANTISLTESLAIGSGLNLLGDGSYIANRRLYGVGFNRIDITLNNFGAAVLQLILTFNGYQFRMKYPI